MTISKLKFTVLSVMAFFLSACATEAATNKKIEDCIAEAQMREGESLNSGFRRRAAVAHCRKKITGSVNGP